jgi:3-hydroxybutyryl-CoA dehydrogenase
MAGMGTNAVGIVGGGLMGAGIAARFAVANHDVLLLEISPKRRAAIPAAVSEILQELLAAGTITAGSAAAAESRIRLVHGVAELAQASIIIEAIPEVLAEKQEVYRQLELVVAPEAVVASNTSGLMPDALSGGMSKPERFLIAHFWNPPHAIPLVEVVPGPRTAPGTIERTVAMLRGCGAEPVVLHVPVPGFIGNRLQFAVMREALHLVRTGVADPETIDKVIKASLGRRYGVVGPFEAADLGGLETFLRVGSNLQAELSSDGRGLEVLRAYVERGETGAASGRGFYQWTEERHESVRRKRIARQLRHHPAEGG